MLRHILIAKSMHYPSLSFRRLQDIPPPPPPKLDGPRLVSILLLCGEQENLTYGRLAHVYSVSHGYHLDLRVANSLMEMYGKCGMLTDAQKVFDTMSARNLFSWNSIITGHAHTGPTKRALSLFEQMQHCGFVPNMVTLLMVISACARHGSLEEAKQVHSHIFSRPSEANVVVRTALVNMYGKCGSIHDARLVFEGSSELDVVAWNAITTVYVQHGLGGEALQLFAQMQQQGELPNKVSMMNVLSACALESKEIQGKHLHTQIIASDLRQDLVVANVLIHMYGKCGDLDGAWDTFDNLHHRDIVSWNAVIAAFVRSETSSRPFQVFSQMQMEGVLPGTVTFVTILDACSTPELSQHGMKLHGCVVTCCFKNDTIINNALVNMYGMCGKLLDALKVFGEMSEHNTITFLTIVSACANQEALVEGALLHVDIVDNGLDSIVILDNALVNLYGKCGRLRDAQKIFDTMPQRNVVSWTTIIASYSQHGQGLDAITLFEKMQGHGIMPNSVTFVNLLTACSHAGLVGEGHAYFRSMGQKYGIKPTLEHYHCMMDLLARSARLGEAEEMLSSMPFEPTATTWTILLSACKKEADIDLAQRATRRLCALDNKNTVPYLMLSNVYISAGREDLISSIEKDVLGSQSEAKDSAS